MLVFFFNDTATTEIYTLSLHDALPIFVAGDHVVDRIRVAVGVDQSDDRDLEARGLAHADRLGLQVDHEHGVGRALHRSEEHTSELQSRQYLVCRLLLEKKKYNLLR